MRDEAPLTGSTLRGAASARNNVSIGSIMAGIWVRGVARRHPAPTVEKVE